MRSASLPLDSACTAGMLCVYLRVLAAAARRFVSCGISSCLAAEGGSPDRLVIRAWKIKCPWPSDCWLDTVLNRSQHSPHGLPATQLAGSGLGLKRISPAL